MKASVAESVATFPKSIYTKKKQSIHLQKCYMHAEALQDFGQECIREITWYRIYIHSNKLEVKNIGSYRLIILGDKICNLFLLFVKQYWSSKHRLLLEIWMRHCEITCKICKLAHSMKEGQLYMINDFFLEITNLTMTWTKTELYEIIVFFNLICPAVNVINK